MGADSPAPGHLAGSETQRRGRAGPSPTQHASPRSIKRQLAFVGQSPVCQITNWNSSINPQSSRWSHDKLLAHCDRAAEATIANSQTPDVADMRVSSPRSAAVVCKAIGSAKPKVPSLELALLRAARHHAGMQGSHRQVHQAV